MFHALCRTMCPLLLLLVATTLVGVAAPAQKRLLPSDKADPNGLVTDEYVNGLEVHGHRLFVGGGFRFMGPNSGSLAVTSPPTGCPDDSLPVFRNNVNAIVADGQGGWYVGGEERLVTYEDNISLVHILPDGTLDTTLPAVAGGPVECAEMIGDVLYLGGGFSTVDGQQRLGLAAIDTSSHDLLPWAPALLANFGGHFWAMDEMGGVLYVAGWFQDVSFGNDSWSYVVAVDAVTGQAVGNDFGIEWGSVGDLVAEGGLLYLAGWFTVVGGEFRDGLATIDVSTGVPTSFAPELDRGPSVLLLDEDVLYVGGYFEEVEGEVRELLCAFDLGTGQLLPLSLDFEGQKGTNRTMYELARDGDVLYMAGHFLEIEGEPRYLFGAVDTASGALTDWNPRAIGPGSPEGFTVAVQNDQVAIGGEFSIVEAEPRHGIASIDLRSGKLEDWCPDLNGGGAICFAFRDQRIYVGGDFTIEVPVTRADLIRVDAETGDLDPSFDAHLSGTGEGNVRELALNGDLLHIGGNINPFGVEDRELATLDAATGAFVPDWDTDMGGSLRALAVPPNGQHLYLAGRVAAVGSDGDGWYDRNDIALVDAQTGEVLPWAPEMNRETNDLLGVPGGLLVGGNFWTVDYSQQRGHAAIFDYPSGILRDWNPDVTGAGTTSVDALGVHDRVVYLGGRYSWLGEKWAPNLGAVDLLTGQALDWTPNVGGEVTEIAVSPYQVIAGGFISSVGGVRISHLAFFDLHSLRSPVESISLATGGMQAMDITPGTKFAGGLYWMLGSLSGTEPGHWLEGYHVPLVRDDYYDFTWGNPGYPPLVGGVGLLDEHGEAVASLVIPPNTDPSLAGITVNHAAVVVDLRRMKMVGVTNALPLLFEE